MLLFQVYEVRFDPFPDWLLQPGCRCRDDVVHQVTQTIVVNYVESEHFSLQFCFIIISIFINVKMILAQKEQTTEDHVFY